MRPGIMGRGGGTWMRRLAPRSNRGYAAEEAPGPTSATASPARGARTRGGDLVGRTVGPAPDMD